jgi:hypothetical protein
MKSVMHFSITEVSPPHLSNFPNEGFSQKLFPNFVWIFLPFQNGLWSAAPYLLMWVFALFSGWVVDWMVGTKKCNVTLVRKLFVTIGEYNKACKINSKIRNKWKEKGF